MTAVELPVVVGNEWEWQGQAACRGASAHLFFHPENERGAAKRRREARAKEICANCLVIERCRRWALRAGEPYGVWGGLSAAERAEVLRLGRRRPARAEAT